MGRFARFVVVFTSDRAGNHYFRADGYTGIKSDDKVDERGSRSHRAYGVRFARQSDDDNIGGVIKNLQKVGEHKR